MSDPFFIVYLKVYAWHRCKLTKEDETGFFAPTSSIPTSTDIPCIVFASPLPFSPFYQFCFRTHLIGRRVPKLHRRNLCPYMTLLNSWSLKLVFCRFTLTSTSGICLPCVLLFASLSLQYERANATLIHIGAQRTLSPVCGVLS